MAARARGLVPPPFDLTPRRPRHAIRCYARLEPRRLLSPERAEARRADGKKPPAAASAARGRRCVGLTLAPSLPFPSSRYVRGGSSPLARIYV